MTDALAELSHLLQRLIGENIELKMTHGRDLGTVKADQGQLEQVIINLAVNARDAMTDRRHADDPHQERRTSSATPSARARPYRPAPIPCIEVTDTGEWRSAARDPRPHLRSLLHHQGGRRRHRPGASRPVYGIVKQTGGFIFVESRSSATARLVLRSYLPHLPRRAPERGRREGGDHPSRSRDLTGIGTLMLVEDEDAVRAFSAPGRSATRAINVLEAPSGEAALELLARARRSRSTF